MKLEHLHHWDLTPKEAVALQKELGPRVVRTPRIGRVRQVAGVDVHYQRGGDTSRAVVAVVSFPDLAHVETVAAETPTVFPYVPGLLSFREIPAVATAFEKLQTPPDLILCDGHGYAHPRRFGLACHLGLLTGIPTVGVAKTRLVGTYEEPDPEGGSRSPLMDEGEVVGMVLRTRTRVKPVFVSVGHLVDLSTAVEYTIRCLTRYRLPEPSRAAHRAASDPAILRKANPAGSDTDRNRASSALWATSGRPDRSNLSSLISVSSQRFLRTAGTLHQANGGEEATK